MFVPPNKKNISSNSSIDTHEPTNKLWGASLKKCSETATVNKTGFKVMALNIFSLMPHLDELRVFISDNKPHIIGINETKIDSTIQNSDIEIDDYVIERNDRDKHGGVVALYIHKPINYRLKPRPNELNISLNFVQQMFSDVACCSVMFSRVGGQTS